MRLLVHVGFHRAASTAIQTWLQQAQPALDRQGCFVVAGERGTTGSLFNVLTGQTLAVAGAETAAAAINEELAASKGQYRCGIISDENLLGPMPRRGVAAFAALDRLASVFNILSREHEIVPVIVLRDHVNWLASLYRVAQFRCETAAFDEFAAGILATDTPFAGLVERLSQSVGKAKPIVASLESIAGDSGQAFLAEISAALDVENFSAKMLPKLNVTPLPLSCELRQKVARRGGLLIVEGQPELTHEIGRLWHRKDLRTPEAMARLVEMVRELTVKMPELQRFNARIARGQHVLKARGQGRFWPNPGPALDAVNTALRAAMAPIVPEAEVAALRTRFAADRDWISRHHPQASLAGKETP